MQKKGWENFGQFHLGLSGSRRPPEFGSGYFLHWANAHKFEITDSDLMHGPFWGLPVHLEVVGSNVTKTLRV